MRTAEPGACPANTNVVQTCSQIQSAGPCPPFNMAGCPFCAIPTVRGTNGLGTDALAMWRDENPDTGLGGIYVSRSSSSTGFIDLYSTPSHAHNAAGSFAITGPAVSPTVQEGTGLLVAAINNTPGPRVEIINPFSIPPGTVMTTFSCVGSGVTSFDYVMTDCFGNLAALATLTGGNIALVHLNPGPPQSCIIVPLGGSPLRNEYLVSDIHGHFWVATSSGPNRLTGTLFLVKGNQVTAFPEKGGRYVMPDLPYADAGNPCTDPSRPHVFVVQQTTGSDGFQGRLMRIDHFGTVVAETIWPIFAPPPPTPPQNYGPTDMVGPINVDVDAPSPGCATGGTCGRVWVSLLISPIGGTGQDRVWDVFDRNLCPLVGCGLGGDPPNTSLCAPAPSCTPCFPSSCRTSVCSNSPYRTPFVKGNGASRFRDLISPCCGTFASQQWRWPWPRRRVL